MAEEKIYDSKSGYEEALRRIREAKETGAKELDLMSLCLEELPEELFELTELEVLELGSRWAKENDIKGFPVEYIIQNDPELNMLDVLPPGIGNLSCLKLLGLSYTQVAGLPNEMSNLSSLQVLDLSDTQLLELPFWVRNLTNLRFLDLRNTQLTEFPSVVNSLTSLHQLILDNTEITEVPSEIGNLILLHTLSLRDLPISELPSEIRELSSLQTLDLSDTLLNQFPIEITELSALEWLSLSGTNLSILPSEISKLVSLQSLYLSRTNIRELPPEIGNLTALQTLALRGTFLRQLPNEISTLSSLRLLALRGMKLKRIPDGIFKLTSLKVLEISNTNITEIPQEICNLTSLQTLDLSETSLSKLPAAISELSSLQILNLTDTKLNELPVEIGNMISLQKLYVGNTKIHRVPEEIRNLVSLQVLDISETYIDIFPKEIIYLNNLKRLNLSGTRLSKLPAEIVNLKYLQSLDLSSTQLHVFPDEIIKILSLQRLKLNDTQICNLPSDIGNLTFLQKLDIRGTLIDELPSEISNLNSLRHFYMGRTPLSEIPSEIGNLKYLQILDLSNTKITSLPSGIGNITFLHTLDVSSTQLSRLPSSIIDLEFMQRLNLNNTKLKELPFGISNFSFLHTLELRHTELKELPSEIDNLGFLRKIDLRNSTVIKLPECVTKLKINIICHKYDMAGINVYNCPLESPPVEIVKQGKEAIRNYFEELKKGVEKLFEAKLIIVGRGRVGKTWLVNRLVYDKLPEETEDKTTEGIDIHRWDITAAGVDNFRVNFWDFGGQAIYHSTHQYFLTKRSLYLFIWEARQDEDKESFGYWLNVISLLSDNSPVLIVMNKCDERDIEIDMKGIQRSYPNVMGAVKVSAKTGEGIGHLRELISSNAAVLEHIGQELPVTWKDIRNELEGLKENDISFERYLEICGRHEQNREQAVHLSRYYHDLGVILHFEGCPILEPIVFLNPEWATDAAYEVLDAQLVIDNKGSFTYDELQRIWQGYPMEKHAALLELMIRFELCFRLGETRTYIVPLRLVAEKPDNVYMDMVVEDTYFEYKYEFMPAGIIERFIARTHQIHDDNKFWKNGVMLKIEDAAAKVEADVFSRKVTIQATGVRRTVLVEVIREHIGHIHKTLNNPDVREYVYCPCSKCQIEKDDSKKNKFEIKKLQERLLIGRKTIECNVSYEDVDVEPMLNKVMQFVVTKDIFDEFTQTIAILSKKDKKELLNLMKDMQDGVAYGDVNGFSEGWRGKLSKILKKDCDSVRGAMLFEILKKAFEIMPGLF